MSTTVNIGGERLGSGNKMNVRLHGFERSTHDLGYIWRNTQSPGTLGPFMVEVGLPGDSFDINLNADVKTMPTFAPLFASFKLQLDVFKCPIRLYQVKLHHNKLNIGLEMDKIKLPLMKLHCKSIDPSIDTPYGVTQQINPSSLLAYLGIRGVGTNLNTSSTGTTPGYVERHKNAVSYLAYWDIYKNYYANKQEEIGAMIDNYILPELHEIEEDNQGVTQVYDIPLRDPIQPTADVTYAIGGNKLNSKLISVHIAVTLENGTIDYDQVELVDIANISSESDTEIIFTLKPKWRGAGSQNIKLLQFDVVFFDYNETLGIRTFDLSNIDRMREDILSKVKDTGHFIIDSNTYAPYGMAFVHADAQNRMASAYVQQSLALKTYQSDLFNNWISTEWIDGENGINAVTAVDTSGGSFSIDTLNLSQKVYNMLNRIAVSGGSYQDWIEAVYDVKSFGKTETPIYCGGLSKEIIFNEVVGTAETNINNNNRPLGSLAGKGNLSSKHKGGYIQIKCDEPCYIMGIVSITPRIDYSQGNRWDTRLKTMDDFHKPSLDGIGYQDLITELMYAGESFGENDSTEVLYSAGKQPAWINYMTNFNRCYGNFALKDNQMFMTLNRNYKINKFSGKIEDLTTYIDPSKYNYAFAQTDIKAMNFWVQIANDITARRKMSAKQIPNL